HRYFLSLFLFVATTSLMMSTARPPFMMKSPDLSQKNNSNFWDRFGTNLPIPSHPNFLGDSGMATITKRGEFQYQAKVRRKGFPTQSKTFERKQDALDWAATIESEIRRGVFLDRSELERTTLGDALTAYMTDIAQSLKSRVSVQSRVNAWLKHPL